VRCASVDAGSPEAEVKKLRAAAAFVDDAAERAKTAVAATEAAT
jgi:hypothetical protein